MQPVCKDTHSAEISVLVVDDSLVFRRFLRDIFEDCPDINIVGEARNGIEALDLVLKTDPDVILLDVEMPIMDGMTALQHLMIHRPIPTIMFSSLTNEGTARCFDTMKNGAVDFVCKDFISQETNLFAHRQLVLEKVRKATRVKIHSREPVSTSFYPFGPSAAEEQRIVFCEECGHKETVTSKLFTFGEKVVCSNCGDMIEFEVSPAAFQKISFVTVICGGEGSFSNLLGIIPKLESEMGGIVIGVVHGNVQHLDAFSEYLDAISSMKVLRARHGNSIENGKCYLVSGQENMIVKLSHGRTTLQKSRKIASGRGPCDVLMASVSAIYKKKTAGVILSGEEQDGASGIHTLLENGGTEFVLDPSYCLCKNMGERVLTECNLPDTLSIDELVKNIIKLHYRAKNDHSETTG